MSQPGERTVTRFPSLLSSKFMVRLPMTSSVVQEPLLAASIMKPGASLVYVEERRGKKRQHKPKKNTIEYNAQAPRKLEHKLPNCGSPSREKVKEFFYRKTFKLSATTSHRLLSIQNNPTKLHKLFPSELACN